MRPFDPAAVTLVLANHVVTEFAADTYINVTQTEDDFTLVAGAGGEVSVVRNRNEMLVLQFTLAQGSPSNQALTAMQRLHKATNVPPRGVMLKDNLSAVVEPHVSGDEFVILKQPDADYQTGTPGPRQWRVAVPRPQLMTAGNISSTGV